MPRTVLCRASRAPHPSALGRGSYPFATTRSRICGSGGYTGHITSSGTDDNGNPLAPLTVAVFMTITSARRADPRCLNVLSHHLDQGGDIAEFESKCLAPSLVAFYVRRMVGHDHAV